MATPKSKPQIKEVTNRHVMKRLDRLDKRFDRQNALLNGVMRVLTKLVIMMEEPG